MKCNYFQQFDKPAGLNIIEPFYLIKITLNDHFKFK
jgi:hypothetical protein